jgi:uncharacterized protein (DUF1800 family)
MALSSDAAQQALIAFQRFGLGAKPGGPGRIGGDPKAAVREEVKTADIAKINNPALPSYAKACFESQQGFGRAEAVRRAEMAARIDKHMSVEIGFVERLVVFWANHFSMTVNKAGAVRGTIGQWERDVVRANVLGRFADVLHGTIQHPAMIAYLDNADSIGPNSPIGQNWGVGYNENLARELLELHTVGSGGGYSEEDVTAFAKILTGRSYVRGWESDGGYNGGTTQNRGRFIYRDNWHEPGPITFMGKVYAPVGNRQAKRVLDDLAEHPATAEHIAFKLVRHFITDEPTPAMVNPLKRTFLRTGGNLKAVALALIDLPESWSAPLTKLRTPYEMLIAQYRALGTRLADDKSGALSGPLNALHQMQWESPSPEGYSDDTLKWLNPDAMRIRLDVAQWTNWVTVGASYQGDVLRLAKSLYDTALSRATRERIDGIGNKNNALTTLFSSPEFQRR